MHFVAAAFATSALAACGFGVYDDTGNDVPSNWWPWVCADGGAPDADGGCLGDVPDGSDE